MALTMTKTIDMKTIRYINLFEKICNVRPKYCFCYNANINFVVPEALVYKAIGEDGRNAKKMCEILGRRIKVIKSPNGDYDIKNFIEAIVHPIQFKSVEIRANEIILNAGQQSKAMLIGRNKARLEEMKNIIKEHFGKDFRII